MIRTFGSARFAPATSQALAWTLLLALASGSIHAQNAAPARTFSQSRTVVEKALKGLQSSVAGRLPLLEGFALPTDRPLERFQRGYYQCTVVVKATPSGGSEVQVSAKITAWYADPVPSRSGYQKVPSNGRLENDLLDQLEEALHGEPSSAVDSPVASQVSPPVSKPGPPAPAISAPTPRIPDSALSGRALTRIPAGQDPPVSLNTQTETAEKHERELAGEARNLEEILHNQSHPNNLAAVRKTGTPVLDNPKLDAKVLFAATGGDEFEILDVSSDWVHVRISGLSRGWIRRSSVEVPDDSGGTGRGVEAGDNPELFRLSSQQFAPFPGDWDPLRAKTVKVVTVQKAVENAPNPSPQEKREFAQALFSKEYSEVSSASQGIVLIFDAEDGGMVAATLPALEQWKAGKLSDDAFWHRCFVDPPELFSSSPAPAK
jgi:hypothetical protein